MPRFAYRRVNHSAEHRAREAKELQRKRDSWDALKAQVASKYTS